MVNSIIELVWQLYAKLSNIFALVSTMIERDDNIPSLSGLLTELELAKEIAESLVVQAITGSLAQLTSF